MLRARQCDALISAGLGDRVVLPTSGQYELRVNSYWNVNSRLRPNCFVLPQSTQEVSRIIKTLATKRSHNDDWHIAVRSGGHHLPGFSNIAKGVTIDLSLMKSSTYNPRTKLASIQTGARWSEVYRELLDTANVTVVGGREGSVGVGGYLLGGGLSFHIGRYGMACNNVVGVEVVLADGRIVNANEKENSDLLKALKGGSNNFGLVTRFDVRAIPAPDLAFGIGVSALDQSEAIQKAFVKFTDKQEKNKDDALINIYSHQNAFSTIQVITVNTEGNMDTKAFKDFDTIPVLVPRIWQRASLADASVGSNETDFETKYGNTAYKMFLTSADSHVQKHMGRDCNTQRSQTSQRGQESLRCIDQHPECKTRRRQILHTDDQPAPGFLSFEDRSRQKRARC